MRKTIVLLLIYPFFLQVNGKGVNFLDDSSWNQILLIAKNEHKFIFIDCFATWCNPCKMMDQQVYSNDTVGAFMNDNYICVRIQMDSANRDSRQVQNWYAIARFMESQYSVYEYPCFLFFSPNGLIVHKVIGARDVKDFLGIAEAAMHPETQFYTKYRAYENMQLDYSEWPKLAEAARDLGLDRVALQIAFNYMNRYMAMLPKEERWNQNNLLFLRSYYVKTIHSRDTIFQLYFQDRKAIDSIMIQTVPHFSNWVINNVIYREEVDAKTSVCLARNLRPNWRRMEGAIKRKYGEEYVEANMMKGRLEFYKTAKDWPDYTKYFIIRTEQAIEKSTLSKNNVRALNNSAYEVFLYGRHKNDLKKALNWINDALALSSTPEYRLFDTKANILYKLGRKEESLSIEQKALDLGGQKDEEVCENFRKMKSGQPTWEY